MKTYKNLFEKIVSIDNIKKAHQRARNHKTWRPEVKAVDENLDEVCLLIQLALINETYVTSKYTTFKIYEPKERVIFKLPYNPDRIVHHAIMNIMEPIWVNQMIPQTYSCIKKRGIHKLLHDIRRDLRDYKNTQYCLKLDIHKFYPSLDHLILKNIIRRKVLDLKLLRLLDSIIDSADGVPIGNYLSQFFANLYLAYFDRFLKEDNGVKYYYRYADDIVILYSNKSFLHRLLSNIKQYLYDKLNLKLKDNYLVFSVEIRGIDFVGYVIRHHFTLIRKSIKQRFFKKLSKLNKLDTSYKYWRLRVASYIGWFGHANCYNLLNKALKYKELLIYIPYRNGNRPI